MPDREMKHGEKKDNGKKARATFQKHEKERARQQKKHDKAQRRLAAKVQCTANTPRLENDELKSDGQPPGP